MESNFVPLALQLDEVGLPWIPQVGDEVSQRIEPGEVAILFDNQGLTVEELKKTFIWLPTLEQIVLQLEIRQAVLKHAGLSLDKSNFGYSAVVKHKIGEIRTIAPNLRLALGMTLKEILSFQIATLH